MKKFFKILGLVFAIAFGLIIILVAAGWIMQDKITRMAVDKTSEIIGAPLGIENVSLSLIKDFPMAQVQIDGLWLAGQISEGAEDAPLDTLARIDRVYVSLESEPILDNIINIRKVEIENGYVNYRVDSLGATSYDFLLVSDSTEVIEEDTVPGEPLDLTLDMLTLNNIRCTYQDDQLKAKVVLDIPAIEATAKMDSVTTRADLIGGIDLREVRFDDTNAHKLKQLSAKFDLLYSGDSATIRKIDIDTEGTTLAASGLVLLGDQMNVNLDAKLGIPEIAKLLKYAPDGMLTDFKVNEVRGKLDLKTQVSGVVGGEKLPHVDAQLKLTDGLVKYDTLPQIQNINLSADATNGKQNDNVTTAVTLHGFALDFLGNHFELEGFVKNLDRLEYDLKSDLNLDLKSSQSLIPDTLLQNASGRIAAKIHTQGVLPDSVDDQFIEDLIRTTKLSLNINDLGFDMGKDLRLRSFSTKMDYRNRKIKIEDLGLYLPDHKLRLVNNAITTRFNGSISSPPSMKIDVSSFNLGTAKNRISGLASVSNLDAPSFNYNITTKLDLPELKRYAPDTLVNNLKGTAVIKSELKGKIDMDKLEQQMTDLVYDELFIDVNMNGISLDMPDTIMNVKDLSGHIRLDHGLLDVNNLNGHYSGIDFAVDRTRVKNLFNTIMRGKPDKLEVDGVYRLGYLDYEKLMAMTGGSSDTAAIDETTVADTEPAESEPLHYEVKGKFYVDSVKYEKAMIREISGLFNAKDSAFVQDNGEPMNEMVITLDKLKYKAFEGAGMSSMKVEITPDEMYIKMKNEVESINMRQVFKDMDNFGQGEMISYKNLAGFISTEGLYMQLHFIGDSLVFPDIRMSGDFSYIDGAIYDYEPVLAMEALPGMRNLDSLRFRPINNREIYIFKNDLVIPKMFVVTNRFDAEFRAMQSLGDDFKYIVSISTTQFLGGKSKKRKEKQAALGDKAADSRDGQKFMHTLTRIKDGKFKLDLIVSEKERNKMDREIRVRKMSNKIQFHPELFHFDTGVVE